MLFTTSTYEAEHLRRRTAGPVRAAETFGPDRAWYPPCKAVLEYAAAVVLFVLTAPVVLAAALLVKLTSRGPAFYSQTRLGRGGVPYQIHKLRTMAHNCEAVTGPQWATPHDPRVTPLGRFLRRTHLDEFPQLWNVLRGEMGLVGPRPERPEFVPHLERSIPHYARRLVVRPGITGLAQVRLPPDTDLASVRRKLAHDLYYVRNLGPWLDLRLALCTGLALFGVPFPVSCRLLRVPGGEPVEQAYRALSAERATALVPAVRTAATLRVPDPAARAEEAVSAEDGV
jgi:lipopolysaccharide/colanic/teichoic acid biosynthesis glycosyltransferase